MCKSESSQSEESRAQLDNSSKLAANPQIFNRKFHYGFSNNITFGCTINAEIENAVH